MQFVKIYTFKKRKETFSCNFTESCPIAGQEKRPIKAKYCFFVAEMTQQPILCYYMSDLQEMTQQMTQLTTQQLNLTKSAQHWVNRTHLRVLTASTQQLGTENNPAFLR